MTEALTTSTSPGSTYAPDDRYRIRARPRRPFAPFGYRVQKRYGPFWITLVTVESAAAAVAVLQDIREVEAL